MFFPDCDFELLLPKTGLRAGTTVAAEVVLDAPEAISSAKLLLLDYVVSARAGYGSGKNRSVHEESPFRDRWTFPLQGGLEKGRSRFTFDFALPKNLPPSFKGEDCAIEHTMSARLDVPWARDPKAQHVLQVAQRPRKGPITPSFSRTPPSFHESVTLEISLDSRVVPEDEPIRGQVALRSGHDASFDALTLTTAHQTTITMARKDRRESLGHKLRIHADDLRSGDPVRFEFPPGSIGARFTSGYLDVDTYILLTLEIPWRSDPVVHVPIKVMPAGSRLYGEGSAPKIGSERTERMSRALAKHTGLDPATSPELVRGEVGPIGLALVDVTRGGRAGIDARFELPSLRLGTSFRALGALDLFRGESLAPPFLSQTHALRSAPGDHVPRYDDATLTAFYARVLGGLEGCSHLRFSDRALAAQFTLDANDELASARGAADRAIEVATDIAAAVSELPFPAPCVPHEPTWRAFARELTELVLVPSGPSLEGVAIGRRIANGDQRVLRASIETVWSEEGPFTRAEVKFDGEGLSADSDRIHDFDRDESAERVAVVRETYPRVEIDASGATLEAARFIGDPREALAGLERFLEWFIDARGERLADAPYR